MLTYSLEEMLATKMRALLQRDKGRDLFDLSHALGESSPDTKQIEALRQNESLIYSHTLR